MPAGPPPLKKVSVNSRRHSLAPGLAFLLLMAVPASLLGDAMELDLHAPKPGEHALNILTPTLLELVLINTKEPGADHVDTWDWITDDGVFAVPDLSKIIVTVNGDRRSIAAAGFKRRPVFAALWWWDIRLASQLYLRLEEPIAEGDSVQVVNDGTQWPAQVKFSGVATPLRFNPAIHVNQEGYVPELPKQAIVGYYLGNLGELHPPADSFTVFNTGTGLAVYTGALTHREDTGFSYDTQPYQNVYEADFTSVTNPGAYQIVIPGMGASLPFRIDEGIGMGLARTYALGLFHQRSGFDVAMPFTRFTHGADHLAPALVPTNNAPPFEFTWRILQDYATYVNPDNPPQTAPRLTDPSAQLFPYVHSGPVDVSGGHFEAGNYSKPAWNAAQNIHVLMFAVDANRGVAALDNLGIPESGDGISDALQEAKWEADFLAKMQDADGGFYYMVHPVGREYESNVLPEDGDQQVVWPKNTATTAAVVAALTQIATSPRFKEAYPQAASNYMVVAWRGWTFVTNALAIYGETGSYQRIMHFDDTFTHNDEIAWAACELFLATGDPKYEQMLKHWLPDPTDGSTFRWGWWRMYAAFGNATRSYAAGARSGRVGNGQLDPAYLALCIEAITNCAEDCLRWSRESAYGTSFPEPSKFVRLAGWYFATEQAFDLVVAQEFSPTPDYVEAILRNINYETGCNPVNVCFVTGLGWKRIREIVDQYSTVDRHALPKTGVPVGCIQEGFPWTGTYGDELSNLTFPSDSSENPYAFYDRWANYWNVTTEASTANTVRCFVTAAWFAARTAAATQSWRSTAATIEAPGTPCPRGYPVTVHLHVADTDLSAARIVWEAQEQEPAFGGLSYTFTPEPYDGPYWIEAEVQWPDGRRAYAMGSIDVSATAPAPLPKLSNPQVGPDNQFGFTVTGAPDAIYLIQASDDLHAWTTIATNTLPATGTEAINETNPSSIQYRYFRITSP